MVSFSSILSLLEKDKEIYVTNLARTTVARLTTLSEDKRTICGYRLSDILKQDFSKPFTVWDSAIINGSIIVIPKAEAITLCNNLRSRMRTQNVIGISPSQMVQSNNAIPLSSVMSSPSNVSNANTLKPSLTSILNANTNINSSANTNTSEINTTEEKNPLLSLKSLLANTNTSNTSTATNNVTTTSNTKPTLSSILNNTPKGESSTEEEQPKPYSPLVDVELDPETGDWNIVIYNKDGTKTIGIIGDTLRDYL